MLNPKNRSHRRAAFSLVEMLVVIAIIAILLSALLPTFSVVRNKTKQTATAAQFAALDTGIATYRAEQALGGGLPPSSSDFGSNADRIKITDPTGTNDTTGIDVAGAHLLVQAMIGADGLGTPGFRDTNRNGKWSDDTNKRLAQDKTAGLYYIDDEGTPRHSRYGGSGYVDEKMREKVTTLAKMFDDGDMVTDPSSLPTQGTSTQPLFVDAWGRPILYYKSNSSANRMVGSSAGAGVYWQEDNAVLTGSEDGIVGSAFKGMDFGAGADADHGDQYHYIHKAGTVDATAKVDEVAGLVENPNFEHTFARFIIDPSIKARPTPVQKSEYLLISAGTDGIYGSDDDVTNWTRKTE